MAKTSADKTSVAKSSGDKSRIQPATSAPRTSRLARGAVAGIAVARAGVAHFRYKASELTGSKALSIEAKALAKAQARAEHEARLGRILFGALNQLKGTALKISQLLSMELGVLPEAMRHELAQAHYRVTPLNRALVVKLLRQELGRGPGELYEHFELQAFAAASLGQVHAAELKRGETVAVKIQYPGMDASISSDLDLIRKVLNGLLAGTSTSPHADLIDRMKVDVASKLSEELDYQREAVQLRWFHEHLSLPDLVVPLPVMALTSRRVLTMQHLPGLHLNEWLRTAPSRQERDHYGQLLFDLFMHSVFKLRKIQADPHAGNFVFMGGGRLGVLDFGCVHELNPTFCDTISSAWSSVLFDPWKIDRLLEAYQQMRMVEPAMTLDEFKTQLLPAIADLLRWQGLPFLVEVYDFGQHPPPQPSVQDQRQALQHLQHLQALPPDQNRHRVWIGYWLLFVASLHTLYAVIAFGDLYGRIAVRGVFNTVGRDPLTAAAVWFVLFGAMMALIGAAIVSLERSQQNSNFRILGIGLLLLCTLGIVLMPASGFWLGLPAAYGLLRSS